MISFINKACVLLAASFVSNIVFAETLTRTSAFVYDADGVLIREVVEPTNATLCIATQYTLDSYGNRIASQTRNCNSSIIPGVGTEAAAPPAPPATASVSGNYTQFATRTVSTSYGATTVNPTAGQFPTRNTNSLGHIENQEFDTRFGTVTKQVGPNGLATTWTYDAFGRKTGEVRPDGSKTYWEYQLCSTAPAGSCPADVAGLAPYYYIRTGDLSSSNTQIGPVTRTFYDTLNRVIRTQTQISTDATQWTWRTQDTSYDSWGRVDRKSDSYLSDTTGHVAQQTAMWTYSYYDILGRLTKELVDDPSATNTADKIDGRFVRTMTYEGLSTTSTNTKKQTTRSNFNSVGQLVGVVDPQNNSVTYAYDALGNQIRSDASGVVITTTYDLRGRKTSMNDPHMGTWQYRYNALGELRLQQNAKGQLTTIIYDTAGRQTERREADLVSNWYYDTHSSLCAAAPNTAKGKPTRSTTSTGYERVHCYDSLGREISQRIAMDGNIFWSGTVYEAGTGRIARQVYPARVQPNAAPATNTAPSAGYVVRNEYASTGLVRQLNHNSNSRIWEIHSHVKNGSAHIERTLLGNNLIEQFYFDTRKRPSYNLTGPTLGTHRQYERYQFDSEGNLSNRLWTDFSTPSGTVSYTQNTETLAYDGLSRLSNVTGSAGVPTKAITYDKYGNILTKDGRTYTYGNAGKSHQLTQIAGSIHGASNPTYSYDANGNMLSGGGATVTWMSFNMVNTMSQGSQTSSFLYGPEHQRVKQVAAYNGQNIITWYLEHFELEKNITTNTTQAKYYIAGKVLHIEEGTAATPSKVETKYLHKDHLGSVVLVTSQTGAVLERYNYDAWGKRRNVNGTDYTANGGHLLGVTDRGYTGHEHLDHLGMVHMNGRIYDASLGRFMSTDPFIAQPHNLQNHNRYAYVNNNPLSYTDPSGYIFKWLGRQVKKVFKNKLFRAAATIAVAYYTGGLVEGWLVNSGATGFATAAGLTSAGKAAVGVASGFASGFVGSGGDLKSALHAGLTGGAFGFAGTVGAASDPSRYFAHAAAGCLSSAIGGADCDQGAVSALAGKYVTNNTPLSWGGSSGLAAATVAGGTVSILSGGKFANGAVTAAFGYLYNEALSNFESAQSADELLASEYPMEVAMATDPSKMGLGGAGASGARFGGGALSSNAARRSSMRDAGLPTSQQPVGQSRNASGREYSYDVVVPGGGTSRMSVQQQTLDRSHPGKPHWEAGRVKTDPLTGAVRENRYGRPSLANPKSKAEYE